MDATPYSTDSRNGFQNLVVGCVSKNRGEDIIVTLSRFKGHDLLDLRVHAVFGGAETKRPTRKGVSVNIARLPDLIGTLQVAHAEARRLGLLPKDAPDQPPVNGAARAKDRTAAERQRRRRERLRASRDHVTDVTSQSVTSPLLFSEH